MSHSVASRFKNFLKRKKKFFFSLEHEVQFGHFTYSRYLLRFMLAQTVKRLPTMRETPAQSLGQEDLLEKEMATHSSILTWKIPMDRGAS